MALLKKFFFGETYQNAKLVLLGPPQSGKTTFIKFIKNNLDEKGVIKKELNNPITDTQYNVTLGYDFKEFRIGKWKIMLTDIAGQQIYRDVLWRSNITSAQAFIIVIDSTLLYPEIAISALEQEPDPKKKFIQFKEDVTIDQMKLIMNEQVIITKDALRFIYDAMRELHPAKPCIILLNKYDILQKRNISIESVINKGLTEYRPEVILKLKEGDYKKNPIPYFMIESAVINGYKVEDSITWLLYKLEETKKRK